MDTCTPDTYVMCDLPGTPASEVIVVQDVPTPLPGTGLNGGDALLLGFFGALALVVGAAMLAVKRGAR